MPPTRRALLTSGAALAAGTLFPRPVRAAGPRGLVVVFAEGGWDVTYGLDPKLGVATIDGPERDEHRRDPLDREAVATFGGLPIVVNEVKRPAVGAFFERWHRRCAVVNGIDMASIGHVSARTRLLTGSTSGTRPGWATIAGHSLAGGESLGSVDLSGRSYLGELAASSGQIGATGQLRVLTDDRVRFPPLDAAPAPGFDALAHEALDRWLTSRTEDFAHATRDAVGPAARIEALERAARLRRDGPTLLGDLVPGVPVDFAAQAALGADLLSSGLCSAITLGSGLDFDTHGNNADQHPAYQTLFERLDDLLSLLEERDLLDDTLVAVVSEFTRTPVASGSGKGHWPYGSALLCGGPVTGGRVYGATDDGLLGVAVDLQTGVPDPGGEALRYDNFAAGLLAGLGVDPDPWYPSVQPFRAPFSS